jgi:hypothetical protein
LGKTALTVAKIMPEGIKFLARNHVIVIKTWKFSSGVRQASGKNDERVIFRIKTACGFQEVTLERPLPKRSNVVWGSGRGGGDACY